MKTTAHQQHAAKCRHAHTTAAKLHYQDSLSGRLEVNPLLATNPRRFASLERKGITAVTADINRDFNLALKQSTVETWLRQWTKAANLRVQEALESCSGRSRRIQFESPRSTSTTNQPACQWFSSVLVSDFQSCLR